jgi:hypothetical protein
MRRILFSLLLLFLVLLVIFLYAFQNSFLEIFYKPITAVHHEAPAFEDPYLQDRNEYYSRLERLETFLQQRIEASKNKDYYLVISLQDSMMWLDINGVTVHESTILGFDLSHDMKMKRDSREIHDWMKTGFFLQEEWATIPKHPIRTKDISGNRMNLDSLDFRPSEIDSTDIYVVFVYNDSLKLALVQPHPASISTPLLEKQISMVAGEIKAEITSGDTLSFSSLLEGDWIVIRAAPADIIAIYRALNKMSQLVIGI